MAQVDADFFNRALWALHGIGFNESLRQSYPIAIRSALVTSLDVIKKMVAVGERASQDRFEAMSSLSLERDYADMLCRDILTWPSLKGQGRRWTSGPLAWICLDFQPAERTYVSCHCFQGLQPY